MLDAFVDRAEGFDDFVFLVLNEMSEDVVGKFPMICWVYGMLEMKNCGRIMWCRIFKLCLSL